MRAASSRRPGGRRLAVLLTAAVLLAGCRGVGPGTPFCGDVGLTEGADGASLTVTDRSGETRPLQASHLLQIQAVPTAEQGFCLNELPGGWQAGVGQPRSGEASLWFASSNLGGRFLDVRLVAACTPAEGARQIGAGDPEVERWLQVHAEGRRIALTIVPAGERDHRQAWNTAVTLIGRELRGGSLRIEVAGAERGPFETRVADALEGGASVLVVDDELARRGEFELRVPGSDRPLTGRLGELLAELGERAPPPHYAATWWDVAPGSCTIFEFDARGSGLASLAEDTERAVGRFALDDVRRGLEELGYELTER
jgi:hypothetical protein